MFIFHQNYYYHILNMYDYLYLLIIILIVYASLYYIFTDEFSIYQTDTNHFDFDLLYKRQPVVINDKIKDINELLYNWFSNNIIKNNLIITDTWERNKYKYLLIYSKESCEVTLCNPKTITVNGMPDASAEISTIKLNNMALIIPFKWYYHISSNNVELYGIHDYITYMIGML